MNCTIPFSVFLTVALAILLSAVHVAAEIEPVYRIEPFLLASTHEITGNAGEKWRCAPTFGAGVRFPVPHVPLHVAGSCEVGEIVSRNLLPDLFTVISSLTIEYEYSRDRFRMLCAGGIANLLITSEQQFEISKPFAGDSENEFGGALSVEPSYRFGRFVLGMRFQERYIASFPDPVNLVSLSITGGMRW